MNLTFFLFLIFNYKVPNFAPISIFHMQSNLDRVDLSSFEVEIAYMESLNCSHICYPNFHVRSKILNSTVKNHNN